MLQHIQKKTTHYHIHIFLINAIGKVFSEYIFSSLCSPTQYSKVICRLGGSWELGWEVGCGKNFGIWAGFLFQCGFCTPRDGHMLLPVVCEKNQLPGSTQLETAQVRSQLDAAAICSTLSSIICKLTSPQTVSRAMDWLTRQITLPHLKIP